MADETQTEETQEPQPEPEPEPASDVPEQLPDDHPLVNALETIKSERNELREQVRQFEDAKKTETERLTDKNEELSGRLTSAEKEVARLRVAIRKGLTETQAKRLVGDTEEELEADADELLASFQVEQEEQEEGERPRRPQEALKPGASKPDDIQEQDPAALAASVRKARDGGITL